MAAHEANHIPDPLDHVLDDPQGNWEIFERLFGGFHLELPKIFGFQITKFMVLELLAAILIAAIFIPLCRRAHPGHLPRGAWWNAFESLLTFIRNEVARPNLGDHEADHYVPFLWTLFVFILFLNLLGMIPFLGSPTANISVTGGLAICSFLMIHGAAVAKMGPLHYLKSLWPHIDVPYMGPFVISPMVFLIELFGSVIKGVVLAIRLFANMFAGHMVLAMILTFIIVIGNAGYSHLWPVVTTASVLGVVALSLLELFVAFLQAYVFVFLTALFMGMALHPQH